MKGESFAIQLDISPTVRVFRTAVTQCEFRFIPSKHTMTETARTFNSMLQELVEQQLMMVDHGKDYAAFIDSNSRKSLLDELMQVVEDPDKPKLFDKTSIKKISRLFEDVEVYYNSIQAEDHPSQHLFKDRKSWFRNSYQYMFDKVSLLEIVRFFAGGKNQYEKELTFRSLVMKLIKTQETVRTMGQNKKFLQLYAKEYASFISEFPKFLAGHLKQDKVPEGIEALIVGIKNVVQEISRCCLELFNNLDLELHPSAQESFGREAYYEALILHIRHSDADMFMDLASDEYTELVDGLTKVLSISHVHPNIYLFQHMKRAYLTHWVVYNLREFDLEKSETTYQAGKAKVYEKYDALQFTKENIDKLRNPQKLKENTVIQAERKALAALTEDEFYDLLLKMYTLYKNDGLLTNTSMPISVQALSSSGNISWEKQNIVSQAVKKASKGEDDPHGKRFGGMLNSLRKITQVFTQSSAKVKAAKKEKLPKEAAPLEEAQTEVAPPLPEEAKPVLTTAHKGVWLTPCFPLGKAAVQNPIKGQRQDISFNNSDMEASNSPVEQEFIINFFNITGESNHPVNKYYNKFANAVMAIMRGYSDHLRNLQKKLLSAGNVDSFTEELLYLLIKDEVILVLGNTKMGYNKNIGKLSNGKTYYFRLFVKGNLMKSLSKLGTPPIYKEFSIEDKTHRFREVNMPTGFEQYPPYEGVVLDALLAVVESLPKDQFDLLNDPNLIGFVDLIQSKAKKLQDAGVEFSRGV